MNGMSNEEKPLNIKKEELEKFNEAMKSEEFRSMFMDYVKEISDPKNKSLYEEELSKLEKDQYGNNVTFIKPNSNYVVKTVDKKTSIKHFINICEANNIKEATSVKSSGGHNWSIPYSLSKGRDDVDKSGKKCMVFDVIFHTSTLKKIESIKNFKSLINETAIDGVNKSFKLNLDTFNYTLPNLKSKGVPAMTMAKQKKPENNTVEPEKKDLINGQGGNNKKPLIEEILKKNKNNLISTSTETEPKYQILHQNKIKDYTNFTNTREKHVGARPDSLLIKIDLPNVLSIKEIQLETLEKSLFLKVKDKYKLDLDLPFSCDYEKGVAKLAINKKQLIVELPCIPLDYTNIKKLSDVDSTENTELSNDVIAETDSQMTADLKKNNLEDIKSEIQVPKEGERIDPSLGESNDQTIKKDINEEENFSIDESDFVFVDENLDTLPTSDTNIADIFDTLKFNQDQEEVVLVINAPFLNKDEFSFNLNENLVNLVFENNLKKKNINISIEFSITDKKVTEKIENFKVERDLFTKLDFNFSNFNLVLRLKKKNDDGFEINGFKLDLHETGEIKKFKKFYFTDENSSFFKDFFDNLENDSIWKYSEKVEKIVDVIETEKDEEKNFNLLIKREEPKKKNVDDDKTLEQKSLVSKEKEDLKVDAASVLFEKIKLNHSYLEDFDD
ncbi:Protein kintoun [Clydaea vesicula]|uniref:Protein kintoun n=1 Tax=Clydaea vesicula TaxID=447962 RepID=A0AAD5TWY9_9FUNG|nr:Protein kintoun [Clydaea vesicula]KAJ3386193.1 Protein kintoun [Lobulomyces angularis]